MTLIDQRPPGNEATHHQNDSSWRHPTRTNGNSDFSGFRAIRTRNQTEIMMTPEANKVAGLIADFRETEKGVPHVPRWMGKNKHGTMPYAGREVMSRSILVAPPARRLHPPFVALARMQPNIPLN